MTPSAPASRAQRVTAVVLGLLTHGVFALAILAMPRGLASGMRTGLGSLAGPHAWLANALLIAQFPLLHSYLLSASGRRRLARLVPGGRGADLATTTFALIASVQLLAVFVLWSPSGVTLHAATGVESWLWRASFAASWLFLIKALYDAGLGLQTGFSGWSAVARGERPRIGDFPRHGLFRFSRHPVYLGFALTLWTAPVRTLDGLVLALVWTTYCVAGPLHKELRYTGWYGERFARYRSEVPYFVPRIKP